MAAGEHRRRRGPGRGLGAADARRRAALRRTTGPRPALFGLVAGLALIVGPAAVWLVGCATDPTGPAVPTAVSPAAPPPPAPAAAPPDAASAPARPVAVVAESIGVDASVVEVGVDEQGRMAVPLDVATVGWYRFGPGPGSTGGSAVLSGHVDDYEQGRGAFYRLAELATGAPVQVRLADGAVLDYRVRTVARVPKDELPLDQVFARDGPPILTLVTCGGAFDRAASVYTDNVVVTAEPVASS